MFSTLVTWGLEMEMSLNFKHVSCSSRTRRILGWQLHLRQFPTVKCRPREHYWQTPVSKWTLGKDQKRKSLQATGLGDFWTARGTGHALLPSQLIWKDNLSLYRHPRAGTSNNFETLPLRKRAKVLHKGKNPVCSPRPMLNPLQVP